MSSSSNSHVKLLAVACLAASLILEWRSQTFAQDGQDQQPAAAEKQAPLGKFVTVTSPVGDAQLGRVKSAALTLQSDALKQKRKAFLVLEITQGSSEYHQVYGMAKFLSSAELSAVTTIAWIPETVTGHNVIVALGCNEIIMHPDAELGDVGLGKALDKEEQESVLSIVRKVNNLKVTPALAQGMMDPQLSVLKLSLGPAPDKIDETRVVTQQEAARLRANKEPILKDEVIWEPGITGKLTGSRARRLEVLISRTAETRLEVAETYNLPREAMREDPTLGSEITKARVILIDSAIDSKLEAYVIRQIGRAIDQGAKLLIFQIDSPGGELEASKNLALEIASLEDRDVKTVAFVPHNSQFRGAYSGAAIISLGCDEIYMHPDAHIGDAGAIRFGSDWMFERVPEKKLSPLRVTLRTLAEKKGRPPGIIEAMSDKDLIVYQVTHKQNGRIWYMTESEFVEQSDEWVKGPPVPESRAGNLLTLNGRRAHELKIAEPPVQDMDDLKQRLGIPADTKLIVQKRTWIDTTVDVLNHPVSVFLLLVVGVTCLYLELHVNGGFLGIFSALCFGVFFWSKFLGGTAGWLEVVLFAIGVGCLAMEIFVIPGFGVFGVSGVLMLLVSLVMASQTFGNLEPNSDLHKLTMNMLTICASIGTVIGMAVVFNKYLPQIPFLNQMILQPPGASLADLADEPRLRPEDTGSHPSGVVLVGRAGEVFTDLRPAGKILLDGHYVDVVSEGPYISRGRPVEIVSVSGNRIVVREV